MATILIISPMRRQVISLLVAMDLRASGVPAIWRRGALRSRQLAILLIRVDARRCLL